MRLMDGEIGYFCPVPPGGGLEFCMGNERYVWVADCIINMLRLG